MLLPLYINPHKYYHISCMHLALSLFSVFIISLITFLPAFNLGLFGDDWLSFWRYLIYLGPFSSGQWNHLSYFFTSYGPQDIVMGLLQKLYGYHSSYYQLTSYILRLIASFSLYPVAWYLTRNKSATLIAVAFFSITTIGLETTGWVFNMSSYIAISFLNIFFYLYLKSHMQQKIIPLISAGILFALAFLMLPIRMHGLILFIILMELFWLLQKQSTVTVKQFLFRTGLFLAIFLIIILRLSKSPIAPALSVSNEITSNILKLISKGDITFLLNPIKTIGSIFLPFLANYNQQLFIGSVAVLVWIVLIVKSRNNPKTQTSLFLSFAWLISSFLFAWLRSPGGDPLNSTHRYLIVSGVGIALFLASIISINKIRNNKIIIYLLAIFLILINIMSTRSYLKAQEKTHSINTSNKVWAAIPRVEVIGKEAGPHIFYFEGNSNNATIIRDVVTFGFPPHMALIYNMSSIYNSYGKEKLPVPMSEWRDVVNAATNGEVLAAYGYPKKPVNIDKIYAFRLEGEDKLINITDQTRMKLRELVLSRDN